jgi:MSHA pilin protein MshA
MRNNNGFTLIELVIVIIVLGVLAATAIPKFINLQHDASRAVVQNISGTLKSAMDFVNARKEIDNADSEVDYNGNKITLVNGYPKPSAPEMRYLLDMDLPSTTWTPDWLTVPCEDSAFCILGNRAYTNEPRIDEVTSGHVVYFWPNGYVLGSCFAYYANLGIDGVSPVIGFEDSGC